MGEYKRKVNDPLNLKLKLSPSSLGTGLFARAFLTDRNGAAIATLDMTEIAPGIFAENTFVMPNTPQVVARFQAFKDAGFTEESPDFFDTIDVFDRDDFDPLTLVKPPAQVFGKIMQDKIQGVVDSSGQVFAEVEKESAVQGKVFDDEIKAVIQESGAIQGVVDE